LKAGNGKTIFQRTLCKGSIIGLPATINGSQYSLTAVTLCDAKLGFIARKQLLKQMREDPLLAMEILKILSREIHDMREIIRNNRTGS
jgi:CRP-like cAMP-binding protein